ncbi:MAG: DUF1559 domain-containing protein [Planctomycetaceae bacterium]|jgi:hypothetical protein|nr:DUF1559 domain-containing protein [Planctomycetaceae bacterium]
MKRIGFTLFDLLGIIVITALIVGLLFPLLQASRETARRTMCTDQLKQLGIALKQYHDVHNILPSHKFGPGSNNRISAFTMLLLHTGHENIYNEIAEAKWQVPWRKEKVDSKGKPVLDADEKQIPGPYCTMIPEFLCPTDPAGFDRVPFMLGYNNYVFSHGDWITGQNEKFSRGVFTPEIWHTMDDIVDGVTNTLAMSERCAAPQRDRQIYSPEIRGETNKGIQEVLEQISIRGGVRLDMKEPISEDITKQNLTLCFDTAKDGVFIGDENIPRINREWSGARWADGQHFFTITNTIMPPNGASCATRTNDQSPLLAPPTSYHLTGVNALMLDGQVRFISNNIDYGGDYTGKTCVKEGQSPFGIWGALGSIADTKTVDAEVK